MRKRVTDARALLAGIDSLYTSCKLHVSEAVRAKLEEEKVRAQLAAKTGAVYCPDWLGARILPNGAKGYSFLIETEDFTVKVALEHMTQWPGVFIELRSHFLHTHPEGARGACEEALCWVREQLYYDQDDESVHKLVGFEAAVPSRVDLHIDWQDGFTPTLTDGEIERFIKPRRVKWHPYFEGMRCTGYRFGEGDIMARVYNKTIQCRDRHDESYATLLAAVAGEAYDPAKDVWRLEFQLRREGMTTYKLSPESEEEDIEAEAEADISAEDLPHIGTLPKLFAHLDPLFQHLSYHWLRLTHPTASRVRSRWPLDPTWEVLRRDFARLANSAMLDDEARTLVRGTRYSGRARLLRKMALGVVNSLEVEDASVVSASLMALRRYAAAVAAKEEERLTRRYDEAKADLGYVPDTVAYGMGAANERAQRVRHRLQMLLGIFASHGVLPLEYKPVDSVLDLLFQHADELEREAERKGGVLTLLDEHFSKVYKVAAPPRSGAAMNQEARS